MSAELQLRLRPTGFALRATAPLRGGADWVSHLTDIRTKPSLRMIFRPALPNVPAALISQAGLSPGRQFLRVPFGSNVHVLNQRSGPWFATPQSPMMFGRSCNVPAPVLLSSRPEKTVKGDPV